MKIILALLLVALANTAYSQLTCYVCRDCKDFDVNSAKTENCGAEEPVVTDSSTIESTTTDSTTTDSTTTDTTTTDSTTSDSTTTDSTTPVTTTTDPTTTVTTTTDSTITPRTTTDPTTTVPTTTNPTTTVPTTTDPTTTVPTTTDSTTTVPSTTDATITGIVTGNAFSLSRNRREIAATIEYRCYTAEINDGDNIREDRGCVPYETSDEYSCKTISDNITECVLCNEDKCNSAAAIFTSVTLILGALLISLRLI